jgi:hypothetical protein
VADVAKRVKHAGDHVSCRTPLHRYVSNRQERRCADAQRLPDLVEK